ncbi:hypothetical protein SDC9_166448 [bioreactor metagenome]|uniref:Uncharacterized protein n=1 Tax=bioreactor metagenome TaxID=1076179 RepID=A0A645FZG1_9ZZZZ
MRAHRPIPDGDSLLPFHIADKRGINAARSAVLDADGAHRVKTQRVERTNVHIGKIPCLVRVRVDAPYPAEAVDVAHEPHLFHMDGVVVADANVLNLARAGHVNEHLAVDDGRKANERVADLVREKIVRRHLHIVEQQHLVENDVANAVDIAVYLFFHVSFFVSVSSQLLFCPIYAAFRAYAYHTIPRAY